MSESRQLYTTSTSGSFSPAQWSSSGQYSSNYPSSQSHYQSQQYPSVPPRHPSHPSSATSNQSHYPSSSYDLPPANASMSDAYSYQVPRTVPMTSSSPRMSAGASSHVYAQYPGASQPIPIARHGVAQPGYPPYTTISTSHPPPPHPFASGSPHSPHSPQSPASPPYGYAQGPEYPASPLRPFACDQCPLSFSRQHDLKRHRDTHTGEKPYYCNGGCGKNFTRKDALKRHQLVKRCGTDDPA